MKGSFSESGIKNIWINPTDSYLVINNKLKVTKHHFFPELWDIRNEL